MQVIAPPSTGRSSPIAQIVVGILVALVLLAVGLALGYLAFGTPLVTQFSLTPRPGPGQVVAGILGWAFAFTAPGVFLLVAVARIATVFELVAARTPKPTPVSRFAAELTDDYVTASRVRLPDGRRIADLVLGPFGLAVIEALPPTAATRHVGGQWEVRLANGRWIPFENPLDRASRDAERVRRWLADGDRDFIVKVYAAVIAPDAMLQRTATCAVVTGDQVPAWLASLPAQRSLTPTRRERLIELIRAAV